MEMEKRYDVEYNWEINDLFGLRRCMEYRFLQLFREKLR